MTLCQVDIKQASTIDYGGIIYVRNGITRKAEFRVENMATVKKCAGLLYFLHNRTTSRGYVRVCVCRCVFACAAIDCPLISDQANELPLKAFLDI